MTATVSLRQPPGTLNPLEVIMAPLLMITNAGGGLEVHISEHLLTPPPPRVPFKSITTCTSNLGNKMQSVL